MPKPTLSSITPQRRASTIANDDIFTGGGAFNLTEVKVTPTINLSPDPSIQRLQTIKALDTVVKAVTSLGSINNQQAQSPALVSFGFLKDVPIEEFVVQENSRANKLSSRLKSNASVKIERELNRKIKEKEQRARLEKVLAVQERQVKARVEDTSRRL